MRFLKNFLLFFILSLFLFLLVIYSFPQVKGKKESDRMVVGGDMGFFKKNYTKFNGNAFVEKGSARMLADEIEYFELTNLAIGRGNVVLTESKNGLIIKGGYSEYYGDKNLIVFFESPNLTLSNRNIFLKGDVLFLDQSNEIVVSSNNSFLTNEKLVAYADVIEIINRSNIIRFLGNSKVISSNFTIYANNGFVFMVTNKYTKEINIDKYVGIGNVKIFDNSGFLLCDRIVINFESNEVKDYVSYGNVKISNSNTYITSDYFRSVFDKGKDILHIGMTNVSVINLDNGDRMYGDNLFSDKVKGFEFLYGNAVFESQGRNIRVYSHVIERHVDKKIIYMKKDVRVRTEGIDIVSDIGKYDESTGYMYLLGNARILSGDKLGLSVNSIVVDSKKDKVTFYGSDYGYVIPGM
ncbi:MAG: hypothetical protein ACP5QP_05160 [Brevinematia bacterium]